MTVLRRAALLALAVAGAAAGAAHAQSAFDDPAVWQVQTQQSGTVFYACLDAKTCGADSVVSTHVFVPSEAPVVEHDMADLRDTVLTAQDSAVEDVVFGDPVVASVLSLESASYDFRFVFRPGRADPTYAFWTSGYVYDFATRQLVSIASSARTPEAARMNFDAITERIVEEAMAGMPTPNNPKSAAGGAAG